MAIWRMAFRVGTGGYEMWPQCLSLGVAAITYDPLAYTNLSKYSKYEPLNLWAKLKPTQKASLGRLAYKMKRGDTIYVKQGTKIICRGLIQDGYMFDTKYQIKEPKGIPWSHQVPVKWEINIPEVKILLGGEQVTVIELKPKQIRKLEVALSAVKKANKLKEALEGELTKSEALFRHRNRVLIQAKKDSSDYRCEVCGMNFLEKYGRIGEKHIIAHHLNPIGSMSQPSITTLNDIALVCDNCHSMLHTNKTPLTIHQLQKLIRQ